MLDLGGGGVTNKRPYKIILYEFACTSACSIQNYYMYYPYTYFFSSVDTDTVFFLYKKRSPSHLVKIEIYFCEMWAQNNKNKGMEKIKFLSMKFTI